MVNTVLTLPRC